MHAEKGSKVSMPRMGQEKLRKHIRFWPILGMRRVHLFRYGDERAAIFTAIIDRLILGFFDLFKFFTFNAIRFVTFGAIGLA